MNRPSTVNLVNAPRCPRCLQTAKSTETRYGLRHSCCDLHSWDGRPLVSQAVHDARVRGHAAFDPIWKNAELLYDINEPLFSQAYEKAVRRVRRAMRNRAYLYLAHVTGLPEPECHFSEQTDLRKLAVLTRAAMEMDGETVRDWWKLQQKERADAGRNG